MGKKVNNSGGNSVPGEVKAILGKGSEFEGKLKFEGTVRIDGRFQGEINSTGTIILGENAVIEGEIHVDSAIIGGELQGDVYANSRVELHAPAKVDGNVQSPVLVVQEGVTFNGNCQMSNQEKEMGEKYPVGGEKAVWGAERAVPHRDEPASEEAGQETQKQE